MGRRLARREALALDRLRGLPNEPDACPGVLLHGQPAAHAVAHVYVEGHPLAADERVEDDFFPRLAALAERIHALDM